MEEPQIDIYVPKLPIIRSFFFFNISSQVPTQIFPFFKFFFFFWVSTK